jgi:predicted acyl esterase
VGQEAGLVRLPSKRVGNLDKGHRLMVQVQSSWFPVIYRNPHTFCNIYEAEDSDFRKAVHRVHHSQTHASYIDFKILTEQ